MVLGQFDYVDCLVKLVLVIVMVMGMVMFFYIVNKFVKGDLKGVWESFYNFFDFVMVMVVLMMFGLMVILEKFVLWFLGNGY